MSSVVLDASLFVSSISPGEARHAAARALLAGFPDDEPFVVPSLFRVEVIAALSRRNESEALIDLVDARLRGPRFLAVALDSQLLDQATAVARRARLRGYDAVYVALAMIRSQPLATLDRELVDRLASTYPDLSVVTG